MSVVTSSSIFWVFLPHAGLWVQIWIVTGNHLVIPKPWISSQLFFVARRSDVFRLIQVPLLPVFLFDTSASREGNLSPPHLLGDGDFSCDRDFSVCQLMPSFPKVFLFSPIWEEYLSRRPYAPLKQSVLPSGSLSDDLLSFQVRIGHLHSNSCYFVRSFASLQGCQVFGFHDFPSLDCQVPGLFKDRL